MDNASSNAPMAKFSTPTLTNVNAPTELKKMDMENVLKSVHLTHLTIKNGISANLTTDT